MPAGRPFKYTDVDTLQAAIDDYFEKKCQDLITEDRVIPNPPTISGLALHLGFADRRSIYDYLERNDALSHTIKVATTRIEEFVEKQILSGGQNTGAIFWLKNKGWKDKQEQELSNPDGTLRPTVIELVTASGDKDDTEGAEGAD